MDNSSMRFRPDVEGLRAVAVISVVIAHASVPYTHGGFMGVDVFFVISGYLISALLFNELAETGRVDFLRFYARRFRRLAPALLAMLAICIALAYLVISPLDQRQHLTSGALAAFWVSNFHFAFEGLSYFDSEAGDNLFLHTWSLGVEEQFYLLWPALMAATVLLWKGKFSASSVTSRLLWMSFVVSAISIAWLIYSSSHQQNYFLPFTRIWQFGAGAAALAFGSYLGSKNTFPSTIDPLKRSELGFYFSILGTVILLVGMALYNEKIPYPGWWAALPTVGTALLLVGGNSDNPITRLLSMKPMLFLGGISYGWYLWHWPALIFAQILDPSNSSSARAVAVIASFFIAVVSLKLIENPIRHSRYLAKKTRFTIISTVLMMTIVASTALVTADSNYNQILMSDRLNNLFLVRNDLPSIYRDGCDDWIESAELKRCSEASLDDDKTVYLIGDSIAAQWQSAVAAVPNWGVITLTKSACPMVDGPVYYKKIDATYTVCDQWKDNVVADVIANRPDIVVLGSASNYPFSTDQWINGTKRFLEKIAPFVDQIIILEPTPRLPFNPLGCAANKLWQQQTLPFELPFKCAVKIDDVALLPVHLALRDVVATIPSARTVNLNELVCPDGMCNGMSAGTVVFRDAIHVTDKFVQQITPAIIDALTGIE